MSVTESTVARLDRTAAIDELEEALRDELADEGPHDIEAADGDEDAIVMPAPEEPKKLSKAEKKAAREEEEHLKKEGEAKAEQERTQALVPWKVLVVEVPRGARPSWMREDQDDYAFSNQKREIDQWADDSGQYPVIYRSYTRDEWKEAIDLLALVVSELAEKHPDYQRATGIYVEEHSSELLLIRAKKWQLLIQVPAKATAGGKKFLLSAPPGQSDWQEQDKRPDYLADLLATYVPAENREILLNIACQYMRDIRIRVNKATWAQANPELAKYMLPPSKR